MKDSHRNLNWPFIFWEYPWNLNLIKNYSSLEHNFSIVSQARITQGIFLGKLKIKMISFSKTKHGCLIHIWSGKVFMGTDGYRTCPSINWVSLKITFNLIIKMKSWEKDTLNSIIISIAFGFSLQKNLFR